MAGQTAHKSENYGDADFMDTSMRLIDLIPRRLTVFGLWLVAGLAIAAALELLHVWMPGLSAATADGPIAALDLDAEGSLATWFSSVTLLLAGLAAVLVYSVRCHKSDDYQGYYRIWLWAAACCFLLSVDEASSLHEAFAKTMAHLTSVRPGLNGSVWWVIPYGFLLVGVGSRLLLDMLPCRLSSAALLATAGCYALAIVTQLGWVLGNSPVQGVMLEEGAEMVGNWMLLLAMGLHARYVILDAEGLLPAPRTRSRERPDAASSWHQRAAAETEEWIKVDSAHEKPRPVLRRSVAAAPKPEPIPETPAVRRKLTKAERKALRKRLAQERAEREGQY